MIVVDNKVTFVPVSHALYSLLNTLAMPHFGPIQLFGHWVSLMDKLMICLFRPS